ncbi:hypothetical protein C0989_004377 [Termitomyces sp. Mn162]|nr:hypothetical protein C0989_004377 [Termitomyces sp. Mn162]
MMMNIVLLKLAIHALERILVQGDEANVIKLFPALEDSIPGHCSKPPPPPPILVNNEEEYEVEEIQDSRVFLGKLQFKMKLKEYGIEDISWKPQANTSIVD